MAVVAFMLGYALITASGCSDSPAIAKIDPETAKAGETVAIEATGFDKEAALVATIGDKEVPVRTQESGAMMIELPEDFRAGTYKLTLADRASNKTSNPVDLNVIEVVTIPVGTKLHVRTGSTISSGQNNAGDTFALTLAQPLVVNGRTIADAGSRVMGRVTHAEASGRVKGRAELGFTLTQLSALDGTRDLALSTDSFGAQAEGTKKRDAAIIGGSAAGGALIGGLIGGKKGALIGAGAGGAAGTGAVLATRGKEVEVAAGTRLTFSLRKAITLEIPPVQ
jgi:hypothetical protein